MVLIPLTQGRFAKVCDCHYDLVKNYKWYAVKSKYKYYVHAMSPWVDGKRHVIRMHRLITNAPKGMMVDHKDDDGLNNSCDNLRVCNNAENQRNTVRLRKTNKSGYKGVSWRPEVKKWRVTVNRGKKITLGYFEDKVEAALAYNNFVSEFDGEFAALNKIERIAS